MSIAVQAYDQGGSTPVADPAAISEVVARKGSVVWVDLLDPTDDDFACICAEFELHPLAMEDARKHGQRPKLEHYPTHSFLVAYSQDLAEVDLFVGPNWVVSVRERDEQGRPWSLDAARARAERSRPGELSAGFLIYTILDDLVDGYFEAVTALEDRVEDMEEEILGEELGDEGKIQGRLLELRRELVEFRRVVIPLREVLVVLRRGDLEWVDEATRLHLQDVSDHVVRTVEGLDSQRELVGNAVEAHLAMMSNRMNHVMKRMTSWGAILLGSTLVAGIYGMNFEHMPELDWPLGYPMALSLMMLITLVGYRFFRRRNWL